ncbi:hypothetical protein RF11_04826 [Thelohanellus kitauei]|uniref:Uncharacterized protein n=1 Tax=Thelohanellus kitauei TaxID=669202 RepID=A0A0C2MM31_THEKT|nr:hypothetical protein RF11_04826 [Thelohanellus kitauei]
MTHFAKRLKKTIPAVFKRNKIRTTTMENQVDMASNNGNRRATVYKVFDSQIEEYDIETIKTDDFLIISITTSYYYTNFPKRRRKQVEIISPEVVQLVKMTPSLKLITLDEESRDILSPLNLHEKELIIFPVNDNLSPLSSGGTHW